MDTEKKPEEPEKSKQVIAAALKRSTSAVKGRLRVLRDRERSEGGSCA